jgi:hypothetical protein
MLFHDCRMVLYIYVASGDVSYLRQNGLYIHLRLFYPHGTPVLQMLDFWPALPVVVQYQGFLACDPPAPEDEDNIMAALKHWQSGRISSILTVTLSFTSKLSSIEGPFSELEYLVLLSQGRRRLTLPSTFRSGPRLRRLHLTGITFPLPPRLSPSRDLVHFHLNNIARVAYLPPKALADALSGMSQLRSFALYFLPTASFIGAPSPSEECVVLPFLTHLNFRRTSEYLECLLARIYAPRLKTLLGHFNFNIPVLEKWIGMRKAHSRTEALFSGHPTSISFAQPRAPMRPKSRISYEPSDRQFPSMIEICNHLSAFLSGVQDLRINATRESSEQWSKLVLPFRGTNWFQAAGDFWAEIALVLQHSEMRREAVLPALRKLGSRCAPLREAVASLMMSRRRSGRLIEVEYERLGINELRGTGTAFVRSHFLYALMCLEQNFFFSRSRLRQSLTMSF